MMDHTQEQPVGSVLVCLMRGVLYRDEHPDLWQTLVQRQAPVIDYVRVIGLDLQLDEDEGYAYLCQHLADDVEEEEQPQTSPSRPQPRLIQRRALSYPVSLLCVLLRKRMVEHDAGGDQPRLIITRDEMVEMLRLFLPTQSDEARIVEQIDRHINKIEELGFLRKLKGKGDTYEVRRVLKALVDAQWLADLNEKLEAYRGHAEPTP
ncbi:MAG: DUF4194 domain-containing protein [Phycisphaeraceae bacterium]